jgi:Ankyrin repeats (3 copies)
MLFAAGWLLLYLNPFWHFDEGGFLDWRVYWWNGTGEIFAAAGLVIEALALVGSAAVLVSRIAGRRLWPYAVAGLIVFCAAGWIVFSGLTRTVDAHFEWDAGDGFRVFRVRPPDAAAAAPGVTGNPLWRSLVEVQIQPLLRGYFKLNDWQKMNGEIAVKVLDIIPIAWPVALGSGGETWEDPDETALMRAAGQEDLKTLQQLLTTASRADVNALDQGGQTALILACQNPKANVDVVKALLAAGADVNLRARNGYAALTWAQARKNNEVARILRRAGARP